MSTDAKPRPYTLEELNPGGREIPGLYGGDRLRATVEERDSLRAQLAAAEARAALVATALVAAGHDYARQSHVERCRICRDLDAALAAKETT